MKNIVIVESPAKAKTIEGFLGKDFKVESSFGHVRDLAKKNMGIDIEGGFIPSYEVSGRSEKVVSKLRQSIKKAETVWLATDEDREGEAIAWHLAEVFKLNPETTKRITFNEITSKAVKEAISKPRSINYSLVNAQQARRVVDRLVGFELSPILWKKIRTGLSAGRVQSVAVRIIVEREAERDAFVADKSWKVEASLIKDDISFKALWTRKHLVEQNIINTFETLKNQKLSVTDVTKKPGRRSPSAPFTTSSLQQIASQLFGYPIRRTMSIAQKLYEAGFITYMRTDSTNLSDEALADCEKQITNLYGSEYHQRREFKSRLSTAQEAHEAIRPSNFSRQQLSATQSDEENKLYQLIWQKAISSQMSDAKINKTSISLSHDYIEGKFMVKGEQIEFEGWLKVNLNKQKDTILPNLNTGDLIDVEQIFAREIFSRPQARYTEGSLVKKLEEMGIGRPSTYAPTITTIQDRGYIEKKDLEPQKRDFNTYTLAVDQVTQKIQSENTGGDKKVLVSTDIAKIVNRFLVKQFPEIIDYYFTAKLEQNFDVIASSQSDWQKMVTDFYTPFHKQVVEAEGLEREEVNNTRNLGIDPETSKPISARVGRYGPYVQIGDKDDEEKPRYASLRNNQRIDTITIEQAIKLFDLPREVGLFPKDLDYKSINGTSYAISKGELIKANIGRFGPYLQYGTRKFVSIKENTPEAITIDEAVESIDTHLQKQANQLLAYFGEIQVLVGRWGPYLSNGTKNAPLGKNIEVDNLTEEEAIKILAEKGKIIKQKRTKKTTKTKPTAKTKSTIKAKVKK